jgi:hypothetical protein
VVSPQLRLLHCTIATDMKLHQELLSCDCYCCYCCNLFRRHCVNDATCLQPIILLCVMTATVAADDVSTTANTSYSKSSRNLTCQQLHFHMHCYYCQASQRNAMYYSSDWNYRWRRVYISSTKHWTSWLLLLRLLRLVLWQLLTVKLLLLLKSTCNEWAVVVLAANRHAQWYQ